MINIGFTMISGRDWTGGYNYLLNLVTLLARYRKDEICPIVFFGTDVEEGEVAPFASLDGVRVVRHPLFNRSRSFRSLWLSVATGADRSIRAVFNKHQIDVVFEVAQFFGFRLGLPAIAWFPDFQHRYLDHLFSRFGYWKRDIGFRLQIAARRSIMLSSEDSRRSCEQFYPAARGRTHVVRFAVPPKGKIEYSEARAVADKYRLPEHYVFLPNQFWKHKNHLLVLEALEILRERGLELTIAASGNQSDPRDPTYFPSVKAAITEAGLDQNFRLLGLIPYRDLAPLGTASMGLLNPSLFEGWSTTVEEALSWGVPLILSDLDVNREQAGEAATYFNRYDAHSLADALASVRPRTASTIAISGDMAQAMSNERVLRFVSDFTSLVRYARNQVQ
ncbi:glycosyltransferase involved in cell wall biosynthesis [Rhizobium sp. BK512]|uniref:glycosyltransferase family 4 protein n=1 Tax=Rhizobium sp. BK512 TaxID=2587010 RepID=UPI000DE10ABB|nr:glycosyltransferase family 1 protein [Rhizobium sp. BK512]MBB3561179.1 glycosyltransferase involved in cell wall biosynthesis [Rhizobium sp. BK512]